MLLRKGLVDEVQSVLAKHPRLVHMQGSDATDRSFLVIWAARFNKLALLRQFLSAGADVESCDMFGRTALYYASHEGFEKVVNELINHGVRLNTVFEVC